MPASTRRKDDVIQIRAPSATKALLNRAAAARGQKLSEFILATAQREAEETLADEAKLAVDAKTYAEFLKRLDAPTTPNARLRKTMRTPAPWPK